MTININKLIEYLPFIIPILIVELALMVTALFHILKHKKFRFGNQILWIFIVIIFQLVGPLLYFTIGRGDE